MKKHSFASRLSRKIILGTSAVFVISLAVVSITSTRITRDASVKYTSELLQKAIAEVESPILLTERVTDGMAKALEEFQHTGAYLDTSNFYDLLERSIISNPYLLGTGVYYEPLGYEGKSKKLGIYVSQDQDTGELLREWDDDQFKLYEDSTWDYNDKDWYLNAKNSGHSTWIPPFKDYMETGDSLLMTTFSVPMMDSKGVVFGVCSSDLSLAWMGEKLESLKPYPKSAVTVFDQVDNIICSTESDALNKSGKDYGFTLTRKFDNGWSMEVTSRYVDVFRGVITLLALLVGIIIAGLLILYFSNRKTIKKESEPLVDFAGAASKITDGHFDVPIPAVKTEDEISELGDALRYMQVSVTDYIEKLKKTTSEKERLASELNVSRNIQKEMLSTNFPKMEKGGIYASCTPAREVGGDLYEFFTDKDNIYFLIGDVSGKGVPAALLMAITIAAFRTLRKNAHTVEEMIQLINKTFCLSSKDLMFVTAIIGKIDRKTGNMEFCNAGHNPMLYISPDGKVEYIKAKANLVIGVMDTFEFQSDTFQMEPGSRLLVYTDGITEAETADKAQYGEARLAEWAAQNFAGHDDKEFVLALLDSVNEFTKGIEPNDDRTVLSISI